MPGGVQFVWREGVKEGIKTSVVTLATCLVLDLAKSPAITAWVCIVKMLEAWGSVSGPAERAYDATPSPVRAPVAVE